MNAALSVGVIHAALRPGPAYPQSPTSGTGGPSAAPARTPRAEAARPLLPCTRPGSASYRSTELQAPRKEARAESETRPRKRRRRRRKDDGWRSRRGTGSRWRDRTCPRGWTETPRGRLSLLDCRTTRHSTPWVRSPCRICPGPGTRAPCRASEQGRPQEGYLTPLWTSRVSLPLLHPATRRASPSTRLPGLHPLHQQLPLPRCFSPLKLTKV